MMFKDAILGFLIFLAIDIYAFFIMDVDSIPMWFILILAVLAWGVFVLVAIDEYRKKQKHPTLWLPFRDDENRQMEVALDGTNRVRPYRRPQTIYNQEEDKA